MTVSIIYGAASRGNAYGIYEQLVASVEKADEVIHKIDLSESPIDFNLPGGYGTSRDEKIVQLQQSLIESSHLIFIYPIYWMNIPYPLKGFIDNVFWTKVAFDLQHKKYLGKGLWKGKKATLIYTLGGGEWWHLLNFRGGVKALKYPLKISGVKNITTHYVDNLNRSQTNEDDTDKKIKAIICKVRESLH